VKKILNISVYGRVAFFLIVSEETLRMVEFEEKRDRELIKQTINTCWNWCGGKTISAYDLWKLLESEEDMTINDISWKYKDDNIKGPILKILVIALMYTLFHALKKENIVDVPESIENVDDITAVTYLFDYVNECKNISRQWIDEVFDYFHEHFKINNSEDYGKTIGRKDLIKLL
jgi:hypothetical protein